MPWDSLAGALAGGVLGPKAALSGAYRAPPKVSDGSATLAAGHWPEAEAWHVGVLREPGAGLCRLRRRRERHRCPGAVGVTEYATGRRHSNHDDRRRCSAAGGLSLQQPGLSLSGCRLGEVVVLPGLAVASFGTALRWGLAFEGERQAPGRGAEHLRRTTENVVDGPQRGAGSEGLFNRSIAEDVSEHAGRRPRRHLGRVSK